MSWFGDDDSSWGWKVGGSSGSSSDWAFSTGSNNSGSSWGFSNNSDSGSGNSWAYSSTFTHGYDPIKNWGEYPIDNSAYGPHYLTEAFKSASGAAGWAPLAKVWEALPGKGKKDPFSHEHPPEGGGGKGKADDGSWTPMKDYWGRIPLRGGNPKEPAIPAAPPPLPNTNFGVFDTNSNALPRPWNQAAGGSGFANPSSASPQTYYGSQPSFSPTNPLKK